MLWTAPHAVTLAAAMPRKSMVLDQKWDAPKSTCIETWNSIVRNMTKPCKGEPETIGLEKTSPLVAAAVDSTNDGASE